MNVSFKEEADTDVSEPSGGDELRSRAGGNVGMRRGTALAARRPTDVRMPFERLESRLLLSASPGPSSGLSVPYLPVPASSLILLESTARDVTPIGAEVPILSAPIISVTPVSTPAPTVTAPPVSAPVAHVSPLMATLGQRTPSMGAPIGGVIAVLSSDTDNLNEDGVTPVVVFATTGVAPSTLPLDGDPPPAAPAGGLGISDPADGTSRGGQWTWGSQDSADPPPPAPPAPAVQPTASTPTASGGTASSAPIATDVPASRHVEIEGLFGSGDDTLTLQIPVGPTTRELGLSVRGPDGGDSTQGPVLGQMSLVDRNGDTLERLGPLYGGPGTDPTDAVTLSLDDAPAGGTLIVQIDTRSSAAPGGSSSTSGGSSTGAGWTVPFVMDVQRLDSAASGASIVSASVAGPVGRMGRNVVGTFQGQASAASQDTGGGGGTDGNAEAPAAVTTAVVDPGEVVQSDDETAIGEGSPSDLGARIATGPLAARTAAPLGPNLSSVMADPAPAVDRHERALSQEIAANEDEGAGDAEDWTNAPGLPDATGEGAGAGDLPSSPGEPIVAIAGLGPLRLKGSAAGTRGRGGELGALQAALAAPSGPANALARAVSEDPLDDPLLVTLASPTSVDGDRRPTPDYLTSACILAVGMGLITGPIIPDLLRLFPARSSRWMAIRGSGASPVPISTGRERVFGAWLRRRLGC